MVLRERSVRADEIGLKVMLANHKEDGTLEGLEVQSIQRLPRIGKVVFHLEAGHSSGMFRPDEPVTIVEYVPSRQPTRPCPNGCGGQVIEGAYIDPEQKC
jgi:hypothetical protein